MTEPDWLVALAAKVAVACNGGSWDTHYTAKQKRVWVLRMLFMLPHR